MKLNLVRQYYTNESTIGKLFIDGIFYCYTLEDKVREGSEPKIYGKTAIPTGTYNIGYRTEGNMIEDYKVRYKDIKAERGMLWIKDIPNYDFVYLHIGNDDSQTLGCILVGMSKASNFIGDSVIAYKKIYPIIANALDKGEVVEIKIERF